MLLFHIAIISVHATQADKSYKVIISFVGNHFKSTVILPTLDRFMVYVKQGKMKVSHFEDKSEQQLEWWYSCLVDYFCIDRMRPRHRLWSYIHRGGHGQPGLVLIL